MTRYDEEIRPILDNAIKGWAERTGDDPDLTGHGATFLWDTREHLLAAEGHGKPLIQTEVRGQGKGEEANLIIDLRRGFANMRMPLGGPYVSEADIKKIVDWIDDDCPP